MRSITLPGGWTGHVVRSEVSDEPWRDALVTLVTDPASLPNRIMLKASKTVQVFSTSLIVGNKPLDVVCKQSAPGAWHQRCAFRLRGSRERRQWNRAFELIRLAVPTAQPLAIIECHHPLPRAWFITELLAGALDVGRIAAGMIGEATFRERRRLIGEVADLTGVLFRAGLIHRDFKASNILVTAWRTEPKLWLVDLDGITRRSMGRKVSDTFAVVRLAASLESHQALSRVDRLRFLIRWLECHDLDTMEWKRYWRSFAGRVETYNRRAGKRKRGKLDGYTGEPTS